MTKPITAKKPLNWCLVAAVRATDECALCVPALALVLGVLSGTNRLFEIVYLTWWYIVLNLGNENAMLNFIPLANPQAIFVYLAATGLLLGVAIVGRIARV